MEKTKYPQFRFHKEWIDYIHGISDPKVELNLYHAIEDYGLDGIEPTSLKGEVLEYFNKHIKPILDRQHINYDDKG